MAWTGPRACDVAVDVLRDEGRPGLMYGDCDLLGEIADRLGMKSGARVLQALSRTPGILVRRRVRVGGLRVLQFTLPERVVPGRGGVTDAPELSRDELARRIAAARAVKAAKAAAGRVMSWEVSEEEIEAELELSHTHTTGV